MTLSERLLIKYDRFIRQQGFNNFLWSQLRGPSTLSRFRNDHSKWSVQSKNTYRYSGSLVSTGPTTACEWYNDATAIDTKLQRRYFYNSSLMRRHSCLLSNSKFMNYNHTAQRVAQHQSHQQRRHIVSWLPEALQSITIWGGSGFILKSLHTTFHIPYWACFVAMSLGVRIVLFPLVLYAAHNATRFAKIAPDVQFQLALFQKDMAHYRTMKATTRQFLYLMRINLQTLSATYKINKVNPLTVFLSPVLQIPIFWYISVDMRKIVNGLDPLLAQSLVESSVGWIPDLTEADPWYGLPVIAGVLLYGNMEVALGKRNMAGEATAKADTAILLKDLFQSLAVFMPCFTSQLPAGVQVYVVTSFCYTLVQSVALRTESFRQLVGLPSLLTKPGPGRFTSEMMELKLLEQKARELRGDGPLLGTGVLVHGWEISFAGKFRPTTIKGSRNVDNVESDSSHAPLIPFRIQASAVTPNVETPVTNTNILPSIMSGPYIHGISAPLWQIQQQQLQEKLDSDEKSLIDESIHGSSVTPASTDDREYMVHYTDDVMEQANRGVRLPTIVAKPIKGVPYQPLKKVSIKKQRGTTKSKKRR